MNFFKDMPVRFYKLYGLLLSQKLRAGGHAGGDKNCGRRRKGKMLNIVEKQFDKLAKGVVEIT